MSRFEELNEEAIFSPEDSEVVFAQIQKFDELLDEMSKTGSNPTEHLADLQKIVDAINESDPSFGDILIQMEKEKETDGSEKLPGQAIMEALEKYALEKTDSKKAE